MGMVPPEGSAAESPAPDGIAFRFGKPVSSFADVGREIDEPIATLGSSGPKLNLGDASARRYIGQHGRSVMSL